MQQIVELLQILSDKNIHSGVELGKQLGVSRSAVWKLIRKAQHQYGVDVVSTTGVGYSIRTPIEWLDKQKISNLIDATEARFLIDEIHILRTVASTNEIALQAANNGAGKGCVWLAEHQSSGRGRRGKSWVSPLLGNIYCSLLWKVSGGAHALEGLSLVVGLAIADALTALGLTGVAIKWPNDIWVDGAKLGGILVEIAGDPLSECNVIIGFGINVRLNAQARNGIDQLATSLEELGMAVERNRLAAAILRFILMFMEEHRCNGFVHFSEKWKKYDALNGKPVSVLGGGGLNIGVCSGINERGAMLLMTPTGLQEIYAGEVSVRPAY